MSFVFFAVKKIAILFSFVFLVQNIHSAYFESSHFPFASNFDGLECNYTTMACAPLSDIWGFEKDRAKFALVGMINGLSVVDASNVNNLTHVSHIHGCLTEWRDIKVRGNTVYLVNDKTDLCTCYNQPCQDTIRISNTSGTFIIGAHEGTFSKPLRMTGDVTAELVVSEPFNGCGNITSDFSGKIVLIQRGKCSFKAKVVNAQHLGAVGVIVINDRQDVVPPTMTGDEHVHEEVTIASVLVSLSHGTDLVSNVKLGHITKVSLLNASRVVNDLYRRPDGLVIIDMSDPYHPRVANKTSKFFTFAHNIFVEQSRPYLYACGVSCLADDLECTLGLKNGGVMVFDISDPFAPELVGSFDDVYLHDVVVEHLNSNDRYILYGAAINDAAVYRLDVTNVSRVGQHVVYFKTPEAAHNAWFSRDQNFLYVTHEDSAMPITVYDIRDPIYTQYITNISVNAFNETIPHNVIVEGDLLWASYYSEGVLVWDVQCNAAKLTQVAHIDTSIGFYNGYHGVWGIYPLPRKSSNQQHNNNNSKLVQRKQHQQEEQEPIVAYASDIEAGLFVLTLKDYNPRDYQQQDTCEDDGDSGGGGGMGAPKAGMLFVGAMIGVLLLFGVYATVKQRRNKEANQQQQQNDQQKQQQQQQQTDDDNNNNVDDDDDDDMDGNNANKQQGNRNRRKKGVQKKVSNWTSRAVVASEKLQQHMGSGGGGGRLERRKLDLEREDVPVLDRQQVDQAL